jgi:hypothetical protein
VRVCATDVVTVLTLLLQPALALRVGNHNLRRACVDECERVSEVCAASMVVQVFTARGEGVGDAQKTHRFVRHLVVFPKVVRTQLRGREGGRRWLLSIKSDGRCG